MDRIIAFMPCHGIGSACICTNNASANHYNNTGNDNGTTSSSVANRFFTRQRIAIFTPLYLDSAFDSGRQLPVRCQNLSAAIKRRSGILGRRRDGYRFFEEKKAFNWIFMYMISESAAATD